MEYAIFGAIALNCLACCFCLARVKRRSDTTGIVLGFFLGPLGVLILLLMPDAPTQYNSQAAQRRRRTI